jgi:hypothetical protein
MYTFYSYLQFPSNINLNTEEEGSELLKKISLIIDRADCENGSILFYQKSNKEAFYEELYVFEQLISYFGALSFQEAIDLLLSEAIAKNWEEKPKFINDSYACKYTLQHDGTAEFTDNLPDFLKEVSERSLSINNPDEEKCVLITMSPLQLGHNPISVVKKERDKAAMMCQFYVVHSFEELDTWYEQNRQTRTYNMDDHRHIQTHADYRNGKSPLLGGMGGKMNAAELLKTAMGDQRSFGYLINYDPAHHCYIRFETEMDPKNQFHGYHLVFPSTHKPDVNEENKISPRLKMILKYKTENGG